MHRRRPNHPLRIPSRPGLERSHAHRLQQRGHPVRPGVRPPPAPGEQQVQPRPVRRHADDHVAPIPKPTRPRRPPGTGVVSGMRRERGMGRAKWHRVGREGKLCAGPNQLKSGRIGFLNRARMAFPAEQAVPVIKTCPAKCQLGRSNERQRRWRWLSESREMNVEQMPDICRDRVH